ncbi:MAG: Regulatory protein AtoC [Syntrophus sp. SKADARSKE-3]|nr:Regulatory protein AtoC [Syntrophus sp. SKADARSKE-3]
MAKILIIDDDYGFADLLSTRIKELMHETVLASTLEEGLRLAMEGGYDVIFLDVGMPDGSGLEWLVKFQETPSLPEVIIMTGSGDPDGAEMAIKSGAWDYIEKPSSTNMMSLSLIRALQYHQVKATSKRSATLIREGIIGKSAPIMTCLDSVAEAATSGANVLITGETGTGKELMAWAIHRNSPRSGGNFVVVDCAALTDTLVESILFGHEKGAYTGADRQSEGLIRQADGGTLFLDEVGELPLSIQKAFLRVLQERRFRPIGSKQEINSNFRLIAATNRDLEQMVLQGNFRNDLLFRIRSFIVETPPLREHIADINDLVLHYTEKFCRRYNMEIKDVSPELLETMAAYEWPGNVRELINTLERAITTAHDQPVLFSRHLPTHIRVKIARKALTREPAAEELPVPEVAVPFKIPKFRDFRETALNKIESHYVQQLMISTADNTREACMISGLSRSRLYELLKKYGMVSNE